MPAAGKKFLPAIFAEARKRGVSHEELHDTIWLAYQKRSLKDLTAAQSIELIQGLRGESEPQRDIPPDRRRAMNAHGRKDYDTTGEAAYMVNDAEMNILRKAATLRGWSDETLHDFVERQLGHRNVRTMADFNKVLWPLKRMNKRDGLHA